MSALNVPCDKCGTTESDYFLYVDGVGRFCRDCANKQVHFATPRDKMRRVLFLASYCGDEHSGCSNERPCIECLKMCNVVDVAVGRIVKNHGGWDQLVTSREEK